MYTNRPLITMRLKFCRNSRERKQTDSVCAQSAEHKSYMSEVGSSNEPQKTVHPENS